MSRKRAPRMISLRRSYSRNRMCSSDGGEMGDRGGGVGHQGCSTRGLTVCSDSSRTASGQPYRLKIVPYRDLFNEWDFRQNR